jgi:hypothetical protein
MRPRIDVPLARKAVPTLEDEEDASPIWTFSPRSRRCGARRASSVSRDRV